MNNLVSLIRKLARSIEFQTLYSASKNMNNIKLFHNDIDLSNIQILFLHWLEVYYRLYQLLAQKEEFLNETVIENDMYCDSFIFYKNYITKHKKKKSDTNVKSSNKKLLHRYTFA